MNPVNAAIHQRADKVIAAALARDGTKPPCCAGCFHCCREPVYSTLSEVRDLLELLTDEEREEVKTKTSAWLERFLAAGYKEQIEPGAFDYRRLNLWCPLLKNGLCSAYERRPLACRVHIAYESSKGCEDDNLRPKQKFATFPDFIKSLNAQRLEGLEDGEVEIYDHLGVLLAMELLGYLEPTAARFTFTASADISSSEPGDAVEKAIAAGSGSGFFERQDGGSRRRRGTEGRAVSADREIASGSGLA